MAFHILCIKNKSVLDSVGEITINKTHCLSQNDMTK